ncbi:ATPase domain-containing protein [Caulobacter hibisci]|uniref:non-specific serine/threonine protein kinase n=1 Tax=Caulobacter hibisci TaxID=2035993 RepID=A0ABS0STD6_9CAUL|nr:ATPase domain-containing protein [Caulobacter hibisci]MBI1682894.1 circadian clock protein KaiC [Caulobacter hibisci]
MSEASVENRDVRVSTGVPGLDDILGGGLTRDRIYLVEGTPGSGKTTLALQFLLKGREVGESGLYITLSETDAELRAAAASHGWSLDGIALFELVSEEGLDPDSEQSVLHPSDVELGETTRGVMRQVEETKPMRVVFDSLSEMRLLAQNPLRHRRQILALKHFFATRKCTVLLLDDQTAEDGDLQLHSIAHGVISLQRTTQEYGAQRRRLEVIKMRGIKYRGGFHDFELDTGGIRVFERLVAANHPAHFDQQMVSTGSPGVDALMGGGLARGTNTLISGPSGVGKTTTSVRCALTALERGETVAYYLFDEGLTTLLTRSKALGMDLRPHLEAGRLLIRAIDPAELSPGEFAFHVRDAVERQGALTVVIDSLNAYLQAMPGQKFLFLQMHELLTYLNQQGVVTLLILGQHGFIGEVRSDIDLSYLSDGILLFRFFEAAGSVRTAISAVKSRTAAHEKTIREIRLTEGGIEVGEALTDFQGVMTGLPSYEGKVGMLGEGRGDRRPDG